jgi:ribosomal protein L3 glutamine methyltransferase
MASPFLTIRDLLRYAVSRFTAAELSFGQGSTNAYDEAVYLILHTLHLPLDLLAPFLDARLADTESAAVLDVIERRTSDRLPAAYITHEAWMHGYCFYVDERVIVPRSLIGEILRDQLTPWIDHPQSVKTILDLCTGSGCLAVLAADAFPNACIDAVDISAAALEIARQNIAKYEFDNRISLYCGDLYTPLPARRYDLIIANPPYVDDASMQALPAEYRHEPEIALAGGQDGTHVLRQIVDQASQWLEPHGLLVVETGNTQVQVEDRCIHPNLTWLATSAGEDAVFLLQAEHLAI